MRILALDLGDVWVGTALSDPMGFLAKPYKTIKAPELGDFIQITVEQYQIKTVVIGNPTTLKGQQSEQTKKVHALKSQLQEQFPEMEWILWDERLSSKQAEKYKKGSSKEQKINLHSIAAALILETYLNYLQFQKSLE